MARCARGVVAVVAGVCLLSLVFVALLPERPSRTSSRPTAPSDEGHVPAPPAAPPTAADAPDPLGIARLPGAGAEDAAVLRLLLRTDAGALGAARAALLDPGTPREARMVLAIVLGTLSANDDVLLDALGRFGEDAEFARCAPLALGALREPEDDDDVFDLGDRPWGEKGPGALGIMSATGVMARVAIRDVPASIGAPQVADLRFRIPTGSRRQEPAGSRRPYVIPAA